MTTLEAQRKSLHEDPLLVVLLHLRIPRLCWGARLELSLLGETRRVLVPEAPTLRIHECTLLDAHMLV